MSAAFDIEAKMVAASLSEAALVALDWLDLDPNDTVLDDLAAIREGALVATMLAEALGECDGDEDMIQGWRDYFATLEAHLAKDGAE